MRVDEAVDEVVVSLGTEIRVSLRTGDLMTKVSGSGDRLLLAGLGPLRSAAPSDDAQALLLETESGERWLVRMSSASGLVATVEPADGARSVRRGRARCATVT